MLPNFIVIGAAKCGTTSICDLLSNHPQIFMSNPKEPHFFGRDSAEKTIEWYEGLFSRVTSEIAIGEGSTSYTHPKIIEKAATSIAELIPWCRLIYVVRHPIKRLESDWKMRRHEGWATGSINQAVLDQPTLISHGMYWRNLSVYRNLFPPEQIMVVFLEDFIANPAKELRRCCEFIGVESEFAFADMNRPRNDSDGYRKDGLIVAILRKTSLLRRIAQTVPPSMVQIGRLVFTRKQNLSFSWDNSVRTLAVEKLREDSRQFLQHYNKPPGYWDFGTHDLLRTEVSSESGHLQLEPTQISHNHNR